MGVGTRLRAGGEASAAGSAWDEVSRKAAPGEPTVRPGVVRRCGPVSGRETGAVGGLPSRSHNFRHNGGTMERVPKKVFRAGQYRAVYTTGHISKLCKVAPRTVAKWCDSGLLKAYRIPPSGDRRVRHADLVVFLRTHGMDTECDTLFRTQCNLLLVGVDAVLAERLAEFGDCLVFGAVDLFDVGLRLSNGVTPSGVVVSWGAIGQHAACILARRLLATMVAPLVALVGDDGAGEQEAAEAGYALEMRPPYSASAILDACGIALREGVGS